MPARIAPSCCAMGLTIRTKALRIAADAVGGSRKLRDSLGASSADVVAWLAGVEEPPAPVFLKAMEIILDDLDRRNPAK